MGIKLGSLVMVLIVFFIAKISFETVVADSSPDYTLMNNRSPASIDQSYSDHMNRR